MRFVVKQLLVLGSPISSWLQVVAVGHGGPDHGGLWLVLRMLGGLAHQPRNLGDDLAPLGQRVDGAGRPNVLGAQGAFQGLGQGVGVLAGVGRGWSKVAARRSKGGYVLRE